MVEGSVRSPESGDRARFGRREDSVELDEFPAAIVCAHCGRGDCSGRCEDRDGASQVFAIVPWERPGKSWIRRLWSTARVATLNHETFFGSLPGGDIGAALRFAATAELAAVTLHAGLLTALAAVAFPDWCRAALDNPTVGLWLLRGALLGLPAFAAGRLLLHLAHGVGLDLAARQQGGRGRHGLRFGCYSCGWDLLLFPLGLVLTTFALGPRAAWQALSLVFTLPRRAAAAYLGGVHQLSGEAAQRARRIAGLLPAALLLIACAAVAVAAFALSSLGGG